MLGDNNTPFAAIGFEQAHRDGEDMGVIAVRGTYRLLPQGTLELGDKQEVVLVDAYAGDPQATPLLKPADLVPYKPSTDVTVLAISHRPSDRVPDESWLAGVRAGEHRYAVRVCGPRKWLHDSKNLWQGESEAVDAVAVDYRHAWSDLAPEELIGDPPPLNPLGVRRPREEREQNDTELPMALIDGQNEEYDDPFAIREPHGFSPIPPFWRQRQQFAGTYGDSWLGHRHPLLPEDFDYRFYQCAHPKLTMNGYLLGNEEIELYHLRPDREELVFKLPGIQPWAAFIWIDDREVGMRLNLDGVHIDARGDDVVVDLTWRGWLPVCPQFFKIDLHMAPLDEPDISGLPFSGISGLAGVAANGEVMA